MRQSRERFLVCSPCATTKQSGVDDSPSISSRFYLTAASEQSKIRPRRQNQDKWHFMCRGRDIQKVSDSPRMLRIILAPTALLYVDEHFKCIQSTCKLYSSTRHSCAKRPRRQRWELQRGVPNTLDPVICSPGQKKYEKARNYAFFPYYMKLKQAEHRPELMPRLDFCSTLRVQLSSSEIDPARCKRAYTADKR
jgi:hypothetical protein